MFTPADASEGIGRRSHEAREMAREVTDAESFKFDSPVLVSSLKKSLVPQRGFHPIGLCPVYVPTPCIVASLPVASGSASGTA